MTIKTRIMAAAAATAIVVGGGVGLATYASAQEPDDTPAAEQQAERRDQFLERVAEKLGITVEELQSAIQAAALDVVDEALASGRITQEQADKAKERIESGEGFGLRPFLERRQERREHRRQLIVRHGIVQSSATALGMTPEELRAELQAGDSIADVAAEQSVSVDAVKAQITSDAQAKLDEAVANGRITQERADELLSKLTEKLDDILNRSKESAQ